MLKDKAELQRQSLNNPSKMTNDPSRCDTSGSGLIDNEDFRDLCAGFGIEEV